jgi:hypothetical protein
LATVVTITLAGVLMAGFQVWASFKLASTGAKGNFGEDSTIAIERGKLYVRSSTTGLLILVVSFAFFVVYVRWIYPIQEVDLDRAKGTETTASDSNNSSEFEKPADRAARKAAERTGNPPAGTPGPGSDETAATRKR